MRTGVRKRRLGSAAGVAVAALGIASCGLIRLPFQVVGSVANGTIHASETVYRKSKETLRRDKNDETGEKEKSTESPQKGNPAQPRNIGLLPDLPPEPDATTPPPSGSSGGNLPPPPPDGASDFSEPPLPKLPE